MSSPHVASDTQNYATPATAPRIIDAVQSPRDLHALNDDELAIVADEIRAQIVTTTSRTGGHVASSLGSVETIVALHAELNCPPDQLVFDVGHQAYAHKILTGRLARFDSLRQAGGISGFPNPAESAFDPHPAGHASDSLSVAFGLAKARDLRGGSERVVAVIGDASISGGMAFEALNQIGQERTRLVIVLNDNGMSIAPNVGALAQHLGNLRSSNAYRDRREQLRRRLASQGPAARVAAELMRSATSTAKQLLLPEQTMVFEHLGITCLAPVDGHDIPALRRTFRRALASHVPILVHVITRKGHGYAPAERTPELFHGIGPYNPETGEPLGEGKSTPIPTFTDVFGAALLVEARRDPRIVAITAGMEDGTGLRSFAEEFPTRFMDVGIAEEHAVALASGLAAGGAKPVVAIYSTFLQRALDQTIIDVALAGRDVVLCVDRAGLVGPDGATHQGAFDLSYLRMIPGMRVLAPSDGLELERALHTALALGGPVAIRYPKGSARVLAGEDIEDETGPATTQATGRAKASANAPAAPTTNTVVVGDDVLTTPATGGTSANASVSATTTGVTVADGKSDAAQVANGATRDETSGAHQCHRTDLLPVGVSRELASGDDVALLALGSMVAPALEAARQLADRGIATRVVDLRWAKPLDRAAVVAAARETALVVTIEEGVLSGGVGQEMQAILNEERLASWHKPAGRTVDTITACSQRGLAPVLCLGLPDAFVPHGTRTGLLADLGLDADGIAAAVEEHLL